MKVAARESVHHASCPPTVIRLVKVAGLQCSVLRWLFASSESLAMSQAGLLRIVIRGMSFEQWLKRRVAGRSNGLAQ